jgi:hypothetical protein
MIEWLQALATPAIAVAGIAIALSQLRLANIRLKHDLFDRRYDIFAAARKLISEVCRNPAIPAEKIFSFYRDSGDAIFVLDADIAAYMDELKNKAFKIAELRDIVARQSATEDIQGAIIESRDLSLWFVNQFGVLVEKFKPFLQLQTPRSTKWHFDSLSRLFR